MSPDWAAAVAQAPASLVLPDGERRASVAPPGPLRAVAVLTLDEGHAVAVVEDGAGGRWTVPLRAESPSTVRRAWPGDGTAELLVRLLAEGGAHTRSAGAFELTSWHHSPATGERAVTVDQTNESVVVGERAVVKWSIHLPRRGEPGSPAGQRISTLVRAGFEAMPRAWGVVEHAEDAATAPVLVATVVDLIRDAQDGWDWAVEDVRRLARGALSAEQALAPARLLGEVTARMHVALATDGRERATLQQVVAWRDAALADLAEARSVVAGAEGRRLVAWSRRIAAAYDALLDAAGTTLVHGHGDLHVGQVLRSPAGYVVTDFDGNPVLEPAERVRPRPTAVDVAGMSASLDHVGRVVLHRTPGVDGRVVRDWIDAAQEAFLQAYQQGLALAGSADLFDARLLLPFRLAQEVREYLYAIRHLPHWVYVPDHALADLLGSPGALPDG